MSVAAGTGGPPGPDQGRGTTVASDGAHLSAPGAQPPVKWPVLVVSAVVTALVSAWALIQPEHSAQVLGDVVAWTSEWFGAFYVALATAALVFVVYLGLRHSRVRLGQDTDRPEFSTFAWASMLFAAGIGTDLMFYAVAEPASQYLAPPTGPGGTVQAAREATVWTLFHYGITGWGMYALMGIALGYFAHRKQLPLAVRSALSPVIGRRVDGPVGHAVDIATVLGTIFGVATSLGIGVVMLNVGLGIIVGAPQGIPVQAALVVLAVVMATVSATTGVDKGIRILSQLNVLLAIALAGWVLVTGETAFLLRGLVMNVGDFVSMFPGMTLDTMAFDYPAEWMSAWTLFFWAWWIAWASFVGMFLARISRGRTIGQFVLGTLSIPFSYIVMWISVFGNSAVKQIRDGDVRLGQLAGESPEQAFWTLLQGYPAAPVIIALATFVGLLFYVTSADSGALVMANLCSVLPDAEVDGRPALRVLWAAGTGVLTIAMLVVGGIPALQMATIIMAVPFALVMVLVMIGLHRALEDERQQAEALRRSVTAQLLGREAPVSAGSWRTRLSRSFGTVSIRQAQARLERVVVPALREVADELVQRGLHAEVHEHEDVSEPRIARRVALVVHAEGEGGSDFRYPVQIRRMPAPSYGVRMIEADDMTTQLEVALPNGLTYDVMGYGTDQVCHDVLDHYERHGHAVAEREAEVTA